MSNLKSGHSGYDTISPLDSLLLVACNPDERVRIGQELVGLTTLDLNILHKSLAASVGGLNPSGDAVFLYVIFALVFHLDPSRSPVKAKLSLYLLRECLNGIVATVLKLSLAQRLETGGTASLALFECNKTCIQAGCEVWGSHGS